MPVASRAKCGKAYAYDKGRMRTKDKAMSSLNYRHMFYMFVLVNAILIYRFGRLSAITEKLCLPSKLDAKGGGGPVFKLKQNFVVKDSKLKCLEKLYQDTELQTITGNNSLGKFPFDVVNEEFDCKPDADPTRNTMTTQDRVPSYIFGILRDFATYKDPDAFDSLSFDEAPLNSNPVFSTLLSVTTF